MALEEKVNVFYKYAVLVSLLLNFVSLFFWGYKFVSNNNSFSDTLPEKKKYWESRVSQYKVLNAIEKGKTYFVGDSIIERYQVEEFFNSCDMHNRGSAFEDTASLLKRLDETVISGKPKKVILLIGTNDIKYNRKKEVTLSNMRQILKKLEQKKIKTIVLSVLPVWKDNIRDNKDIIAFNRELEKICNEREVFFYDIHSLFIDLEGELRKEYSYDGIHLNGYGYSYLTQKLLMITEK